MQDVNSSSEKKLTVHKLPSKLAIAAEPISPLRKLHSNSEALTHRRFAPSIFGAKLTTSKLSFKMNQLLPHCKFRRKLLIKLITVIKNPLISQAEHQLNESSGITHLSKRDTEQIHSSSPLFCCTPKPQACYARDGSLCHELRPVFERILRNAITDLEHSSSCIFNSCF